jgi:glycosyltransferase involved in cell wall biosynthesis
LDKINEYVLFYNNPEHLGNFLEFANVKEIYVPAKAKLLWDHWAISRIAAKENVDVILHTKLTVPLLTNKKTIMVLHGTERFFFKDFHLKRDRFYFKTIYPLYFKKATKIIAVSERARTDIIGLINHLSPDKVITVYLAVDPIFRVIKDKAYLENIRQKYQLPDKFIVYVGHIYPGKNVGRLFKAFSKVHEEHDIKLVVAGSYKWKYQDDIALVEKLGLQDHVRLTGHVPPEDLVGFYNMAQLTVFPSFYESFGLTNVEANACGCPLITSKTGGSPEAAGNAAIYIDPLNVDEIADAIKRILSDDTLRRELIEKGLINVQRFSWEKTARETLEVIESLDT